MRISKFLILVLLAVPSISMAQSHADLDKLDEKFAKYFERVMPGWKHERVEPVYKDENVLIQFWSQGNRKVKISILPHRSAEEARDVLQRGLQLNRQRLMDFGDEAYSGGYGSANIELRRGRFTIYISTYADVDSDPDARTLNQDQRFDRQKNEMRRLSMEFAKHAVGAIDAP
jgi:hypothetical protein